MVMIVQPGPPSDIDGTTGDIYIDNVNFILYGPKISPTQWPDTGVRLGGSMPVIPESGTFFFTGALPPTPEMGSHGNYYLATSVNILYGPKTLTTWPVIGRFVPVTSPIPNGCGCSNGTVTTPTLSPPCSGGHKCGCSSIQIPKNCGGAVDDCSSFKGCNEGSLNMSINVNIVRIVIIMVILAFFYLMLR